MPVASAVRALPGGQRELEMTVGWQLILRRVDDGVLTVGSAARRDLARCVGRVPAGWPVVAFSSAAIARCHINGRQTDLIMARAAAVQLGAVGLESQALAGALSCSV